MPVAEYLSFLFEGRCYQGESDWNDGLATNSTGIPDVKEINESVGKATVGVFDSDRNCSWKVGFR